MPDVDHGASETRDVSTAVCPSCGAVRVGQSAYCEQCGAELPIVGSARLVGRSLLALGVLTWIIGLVWLLVWLTGHAALLK